MTFDCLVIIVMESGKENRQSIAGVKNPSQHRVKKSLTFVQVKIQ